MVYSEIVGILVLIGCVICFVSRCIPEAVAGVIGCVLMVLFKACSFDDVFGQFSNSIVILMVSSMIVGIAMFKTGAARILGQTAIRASKGNEKTFLIVTFLLSAVLAMFLANTAILAALIPIVESVSRASDRMHRKNLLLPLGCAVMYGGACTLIGCTPQLTANGLMVNMHGEQMTMWTLTAPGLCITALFAIYLFVWGYRDGIRIWGDRPEEEMDVAQKKLDAVMNDQVDKKKLITISIIAGLMMFFYVTNILSTTMTALCAAIACVVTGCCSMKDVSREVSWSSVIFLGACLGLGNALTVSGTGEFIADMVTSLLGTSRDPYLIFIVLVTLTMLLSQVITNSTAIIIVLPIALSMCHAYGFNAMGFCVGITFAASFAFCTPLAAAQITMTQVAGYDFMDYVKFGWKPSLITLAAIIAIVPLFYPLV